MSEVVTEEEKQRNEREFTRSNQEKLLEVLKELFPTWNWQAMDKFDREHESRIHFLHNNPLHSEFSADILIAKELLAKMFYHSIEFQSSLALMIASDEDSAWEEFPRLYYNLEGVEQLLVVYRAWARLHSSDGEYERINSLVTSYFV